MTTIIWREGICENSQKVCVFLIGQDGLTFFKHYLNKISQQPRRYPESDQDGSERAQGFYINSLLLDFRSELFGGTSHMPHTEICDLAAELADGAQIGVCAQNKTTVKMSDGSGYIKRGGFCTVNY